MGEAARRLAPALSVCILACSDTPVEVGSTGLEAVTPQAEAQDVARDAIIEVRFDGPVAVAALQPIALQVGDCPGPVVAGTWSRSGDGTALRFTPAHALDAATRYTIHVGGGLSSADGTLVDLELRGAALGGTWVTRDMVMDMDMMGMGMGVSHSGPEWRHPNGMYGLAFAFTTAP